MSRSALAGVVLLVAIVAAALLAASPAFALDRTVAASAQLDYHFVPTAKGGSARDVTFDGFTVEAAAKATVDVSDRLSGVASRRRGIVRVARSSSASYSEKL